MTDLNYTVKQNVLVYCSPGTYASSGSCILCNKGSYQDESGQKSCKPCPYGWSTQYIGSQSQQECSGMYHYRI